MAYIKKLLANIFVPEKVATLEPFFESEGGKS